MLRTNRQTEGTERPTHADRHIVGVGNGTAPHGCLVAWVIEQSQDMEVQDLIEQGRFQRSTRADQLLDSVGQTR